MTPMRLDQRGQLRERLEAADSPFDLAIIGGGATGVGVAIDAAARGYRVALCEQHDFGKGTSSRSTKLIHGGVRYLQQRHFGLVKSALFERGLLRQNAPHLVSPLANIVPLYAWWEGPYYGLGMKLYDWLSGDWSLGPSQRLPTNETLARVPTLQTRGLRGGVLYWDAQFDDARLLVNMMQTAIEHGAICINHAPVRELVKEAGRVAGYIAEDAETGRSIRVAARVVVNAAGPFSDAVRRFDEASSAAALTMSQGVHLVFDGAFLSGETALMVPRTRDGRIVFAIPWHGQMLVGTTDTPISRAPLEPSPMPDEVDFLLDTLAPYLSPSPTRADIRSMWAGVRPLVRSDRGDHAKTSQLGRDHVVRVSPSGLVSILGGKWTTYRKMAEDGVDRAAQVGNLPFVPCRTRSLPLRAPQGEPPAGEFAEYGADAPAIGELVRSRPEWAERLGERMPARAGQVVWAARHEMARTVEDVLARRLRTLFLDADAARNTAPRVAELLAAELGRDEAWQARQVAEFERLAADYQPSSRA
jgi:glycerol-3-phosphate dehydrogenase